MQSQLIFSLPVLLFCVACNCPASCLSVASESGNELLYRRPPNHQFTGGSPYDKMIDLMERSSLIDSIARYIGYSGGNNYGNSNQDCCGSPYDFDTLVPGFALVAAAFFFFYLLNSTVTSGRKRRDTRQEHELLDAPTWISMVNQIWTADDDDDSDSCTMKALCRMNHLALTSPGSSGTMVSLSSIPLSYLLHRRHFDEGFVRYLDASLLGHSGVNCANVFSSCPRLN